MIKKLVAITCGSILIGIGINFFLIPNHLINGGMIGVGLILKYAFGFKPGLTIIILSLPLYVIAWLYFRPFFYNGLHGLLISSFFIDFFEPLSQGVTPAPLIVSSLTGGLLLGTGIGLLLLVQASTGGGDLLALMLAKITAINVGIIIFIMDTIVILLGGFLIQESTIIFSFLMIFMIGLTTYTITKHVTLQTST